MFNPFRNLTHLRKFLGVLITLGIFYFLGKRLALNWKDVCVYSWKFHLPWLFSSLIVLCLCSLLTVLPCLAFWRQRGVQISYYQGFQIFYLSGLGRYLPGKVGFFFGFIYCCQRMGIGKTEALLGFAFRVGFTTFSGILISLCLYFVSPAGEYFSFTENMFRLVFILLLACSGGIAIFVCLRKRIAQCVLEKMWKVSFLSKFSILQLLRLLFAHIMLWCGVGIAFFLFVKSLTPLGWHLILEMIGIYVMAWTVGFLSFITPAGLGIREGVLSFLLSTILPETTAISVALMSRFWYLTVELALAGVIIFLRWCTFISVIKEGDQLSSSESRDHSNTLTR